MEDEVKAGPYRPYGPAQECDVISTPSWHFALWGVWGIVYSVLSVLFKVIHGWLVLLLVAPSWVIFRHIPERLMELGRARRGVGLLGVQIPEVICGFKCPSEKGKSISLDAWFAGVLVAWLGVLVAYSITILVLAIRERP